MLEVSNSHKKEPSTFLQYHIGGLDAAPETTLNLPNIPGGKKVIYPHIEMPLTAIEDFERLGKDNPLFAELGILCAKYRNVWNEEAEKYLLAHNGVSTAV